MPRSRARAIFVLNALFWALAIIGLVITGFGIVLDLFPGTSPGFNLPQLLAIFGGLVLAALAHALRREDLRRRRLAAWRKNVLATVVITAGTLVALELLLAVLNMSTYFPAQIPEQYYSGKPWNICDEAGCHFDPEVLEEACRLGRTEGRNCSLNQQGFHDTQDFTRSDDLQGKFRIIALGDSFTFGMTADMGKSYIERIESDQEDAVLWNMGIPGTGTRQALQSLSVFGPVMQPDVILLGFYVNDFKDNMVPIHGQKTTADADEEEIWFRWEDRWGNTIMLDLPSTWYYREQRKDPPASELERLVGITRLGTLALRLFDVIGDSAYERVRAARETDVTRDYLEKLRDTVSTQLGELLVLLIPHRSDLVSPGGHYSTAIQLMAELEIPYIDPRSELEKTVDYTALPDVHWNNAGHKKIGELLSRCIDGFRADGDWSDCGHVVLP
ncbi:MAG: SGNH/GDSL hydrolase family protein [Chloroflexi bacterium]|nr:SGNH/GDSL hydrolase family protein [Chloroflexota bacterium]